MNWSTPSELRAQLRRRWERGDWLREAVSPGLAWPLRLPLKTPGAGDLGERFEAVRAWAAEWMQAAQEAPQLRLQWRDWKHRVQGAQRLPVAVLLEDLPQALTWLGRTREARRFEALWQHTAQAQPLLLPWLHKRPLQALALAEDWPRLLAVVAWLQANPRPGVYLRQVDAAGVDSKFIEAQRGVLSELLDLALPAEAVDAGAGGVARFNRRYGFLDKPLRVRLRLLDAALQGLPGCRGLADLTLDAASFAALALPLARVFITENETNFLAFPPQPQALVVFGAGYGFEALAQAPWLQRCAVHYWGDIDTHGFAILDQLRACLPHATSLLMDRQTLLAHRAHWGEEPEPVRHALTRLTPDEVALYDELRLDRLQPRLRLEQERVGFGWLQARLQRGFAATAT
jgi:hypothetical protein